MFSTFLVGLRHLDQRGEIFRLPFAWLLTFLSSPILCAILIARMPMVSRIKMLFGSAWKDPAMKAWFFPAAGLVLLNWALYGWKLSSFIGSPEPLPVHYSVLVGIDKLLPWYWMLVSPLLATGAFVLDGLLSFRLWHRMERALAILMGVWTVFLLSLFFISTFLIVLLNVGV